MISLKTEEELKVMQEGGMISAGALKEVLKNVRAGIKTIELDKIAEEYILNHKGKPSFKTVKNYKFTTCINVNEGVVHGIPNQRVIKKGDLVKVDLGVLYKGFHTDLSDTVEVETNVQEDFLSAGRLALSDAVSMCIVGNKVGDISNAIQKVIEGKDFTVSRDLVGHGIGKSLHEDPFVPGFGKAGTGPILKEGMVLALEVIYQKGSYEIDYEKDGWTIITKDRSLSALFEHTIAVTKDGPLILTLFD